MLRTALHSIAAAGLLLAAGLARADLGDDWLAGKVTTGNPTITYAGPPIEFKYGHPSPPAAILLPAFGFLFAHGIVFPCAQAGAIAPFPERAGAAAGLFGALLMAVATIVGTWIGASHDGTPVPLMVTMAVAALVGVAASNLPVLRRADGARATP